MVWGRWGPLEQVTEAVFGLSGAGLCAEHGTREVYGAGSGMADSCEMPLWVADCRREGAWGPNATGARKKRLEPASAPEQRLGRAVGGIGGGNPGGEPDLEVTREKPSGNTGKTSDTSPDPSTSAEEKQGRLEAGGQETVRGPSDEPGGPGKLRTAEPEGQTGRNSAGPWENRGKLPR
ncbi:hypothetical protein NDU88_010933 [Pleurodeles waltl]|uniref:Uncharacterized protein n=1 Tax=Pleurodeles waltl TaxID=8319 RepID=A0AAV7S4T0_PLEWA|nr:hypothetical protein NDU88_010933 [Pleurodeles waltl]